MLQKLEKHINLNFPFLKDKKLLIAISGGLDSVVLTHLLNKLQYTISLAHCNFNLRDTESNLDEEFVENLSQKSSNQIFTINFDTNKVAKKNKQSTQITARNLRYQWFKELAEIHNFDYILTAHHADDNLETFLINLTRGSGLDGFTGIPKINDNIIRPLLVFSREEISNYAKKHSIKWREDASNASVKYIRNKIRHQVVPALKEINPGLLETFSKTLENLNESSQIIADRIKEVTTEIIKPLDYASGDNSFKIDIKEIKKLSNSKAYLYQLLKKYNFTEWNDVYLLLSAQSGKQVFSKTHILLKDREFLILSTIDKKLATTKFFFIDEKSAVIEQPIHLTITKVDKNLTENKQTIYVDKNLLTFPLLLRKWQHGDSFYPKGMQGKKKLSKYFKDEKLSLLEKEQIWLLCNNNSEIIWIINKRQDSRFLTNASSKNSLKIATEK
jgi:tRNA(Ile)-lysidine synthase